MYVYAGYARFPQLIRYVPVWMILILFRRLTADRTQHSRYQGYPWLARRFPFMKGELKARTLEPWLLFASGVYLYTVSQPLGELFFIGCASLFIVLGTELEVARAQKRAMDDEEKNARRMANLRSGYSMWGD